MAGGNRHSLNELIIRVVDFSKVFLSESECANAHHPKDILVNLEAENPWRLTEKSPVQMLLQMLR